MFYGSYISTVLRDKTLTHVETVKNSKRDIGRRKKANEKDKIVFNLVPKLRHLRARKCKKRLKANVRARVSRDLENLSRAHFHRNQELKLKFPPLY